MFNVIVGTILSIFTIMSTLILSVIGIPILNFLTHLFPDFSSYVANFYLFLTQHVIVGISFFREVFFNLTGFPRALLNLFVAFYLAKITFYVASLPIRFIINAYYIFRGRGSSHE